MMRELTIKSTRYERDVILVTEREYNAIYSTLQSEIEQEITDRSSGWWYGLYREVERCGAKLIPQMRQRARQAANVRADDVVRAVEAEYPDLRHYLAPRPEVDTVDAWQGWEIELIETAAGRISEAYGLGLGTDWSMRHFGRAGDETLALAGHTGRISSRVGRALAAAWARGTV